MQDSLQRSYFSPAIILVIFSYLGQQGLQEFNKGLPATEVISFRAGHILHFSTPFMFTFIELLSPDPNGEEVCWRVFVVRFHVSSGSAMRLFLHRTTGTEGQKFLGSNQDHTDPFH
jgi:hypothetical protein